MSRITLHNTLKPYAQTFHAIGNITRLSILYTLGQEPMEFGRLVHRLKISPSLLSHHLKQLMTAGIVTKTTVGKLVTYYIAEDSVKKVGALFGKLLSPSRESNSDQRFTKPSLDH